MQQRTFAYTNEKISVENLGDGRHVVKVTPGGAKIVAYISDGNVTRYEAEDAEGNRQSVLGITPESSDTHVSPDGLCEVCTFDATFGIVFCYTVIDCPPPIDQKKGLHII
jgi:hypothetical protein